MFLLFMIMTQDMYMIIDEDMEKKIRSEIKFLLRMYFPDGFRLNSTRDLLLLKSRAEDEQITLPEDDEFLKEKILDVGVVLCEMIFVIRGKLNRIIADSLRKIHDSGARIIFYEAMMNTHREILNGEHIYSVELFRDLLKHVDDKLLLHDEFFTFEVLTEPVISEIKRVWGDDKVSSLDEISRRLIYIPVDEVKNCLEKSPEFVKVSDNKFFLLDKFVITEHEVRV